MQPMRDEPNDMWAVGTVLFQLLMSGHLPWVRQHGPFTFGPSDPDMIEAAKLQDGPERADFLRSKIQAEHELWVRLSTSPLQQARGHVKGS